MVHWDSIESDEVQYPLYIYERRIVQDGEGAGEYRGAPGTFVEYGPIPGADLHAVYASDGCITPAAGARGRAVGRLRGAVPARPTTARSSRRAHGADRGRARASRSSASAPAAAATASRGSATPARVEKDVREGWITPSRALEVYGVAIDPDGGVDAARDRRAAERARGAAIGRRAAHAAGRPAGGLIVQQAITTAERTIEIVDGPGPEGPADGQALLDDRGRRPVRIRPRDVRRDATPTRGTRSARATSSRHASWRSRAATTVR